MPTTDNRWRINGAGIARDAALRGLSVALFEREDWGAGTTGHSTRMIHGGVRYLLYDVPTTAHSSEDAGRIRRIAPHLTWRIPFLWPLYPGNAFRRELMDAFLGAYDPHAARKGGLRHARLTSEEARALEPGLAPDLAGALTLDEWGCDVFRLSAVNALDAREHGATVHAHTEVTELLFTGSGRTVRGASVRDVLGGREWDVEARLVVNAGGPWADRVASLADVQVAMRPGKGVHVTFERRIGNYGMILEGKDGRTMFLVPHGVETIVGTTDDDYYGDPLHVDLEITSDEVAYVIEATARALPQARRWRPLRAWAGVRNTLFEWWMPTTFAPSRDPGPRAARRRGGPDLDRRRQTGRVPATIGGRGGSRAKEARPGTRRLQHWCRTPAGCRAGAGFPGARARDSVAARLAGTDLATSRLPPPRRAPHHRSRRPGTSVPLRGGHSRRDPLRRHHGGVPHARGPAPSRSRGRRL
jgi:glycerol-3-phosphate dehydrogenase